MRKDCITDIHVRGGQDFHLDIHTMTREMASHVRALNFPYVFRLLVFDDEQFGNTSPP